MPRFRIELPNEQGLDIDFPNDTTVEQMKRMIAPQIQVLPEDVVINYAGRKLNNNEETLGTFYRKNAEPVLRVEY
ncbi:hypothetical protein AAVH_32090, partial [Aphelenchoides avenae]